MNTSIYIAKRYLVSNKKIHAVNIISGISMMGILIGTAALIILLSVFNGLETVIVKLNSNFSPDLRIEAKLGKTFDPNTDFFKSLHKDERLFSYSEILQDRIVIKYGDKTFIGKLKGVSSEFQRNPRLDSIILDGSFTLHYSNGSPMAVIGVIVQNNLSVNVHNSFFPLQIYSPKHGNVVSINPADEFNTRAIFASGVFSIQQEDDDVVIVPIEFARGLLEIPIGVSSIDLNYKKGTNLEVVQKELIEKIGKDFIVRNRREQDTTLYKTLNYEKWALFMILTFVLIIASFNIIGSLTMLVIDKRKDIAVLTSLGADKKLIRGIFFFEGMMISIIGCIIGLVLGFVFCLLQQRYGLVTVDGKINVPNNAYPVDLKLSNFILVFLTVMVISVIASGISARLSIKGLDDIKQDL